jgi:hypothetical protein
MFKTPYSHRPLIGRLQSSLSGRALLSLAAIGAVASVGALATRSTFTDRVTMAQISVAGGALDIVANDDTDDSATGWSGSVSMALTGLKPGDENSGTVAIDNAGDLPLSLTVSTAGTDAAACFGYFLRETAVTAGTGAASHPVTFAGMGTASGSDATTAAFATSVTARQLPDDGADDTWEADDTKTYTITVRMNQSCNTNAAAGTLDFTFDATQA